MRTNKTRLLNIERRPHLWFQLYWVIYIIWFFALDKLGGEPKYIVRSRLDDFIPFNEWFVLPYCSWFFLLAGVLFALWQYDTESYDKLCLMMFSGMTLCLIIYMLLPNGLDIRPAAEDIGRSNIAVKLMGLIWQADDPNNVCPSIHCQSSACMALAFCKSKLAERRPARKAVAVIWCALICLSTLFTKQHSVIDVACGLAVALVWAPVLYRRHKS